MGGEWHRVRERGVEEKVGEGGREMVGFLGRIIQYNDVLYISH